jgi:hypothetical protein
MIHAAALVARLAAYLFHFFLGLECWIIVWAGLRRKIYRARRCGLPGTCNNLMFQPAPGQPFRKRLPLWEIPAEMRLYSILVNDKTKNQQNGEHQEHRNIG